MICSGASINSSAFVHRENASSRRRNTTFNKNQSQNVGECRILTMAPRCHCLTLETEGSPSYKILNPMHGQIRRTCCEALRSVNLICGMLGRESNYRCAVMQVICSGRSTRGGAILALLELCWTASLCRSLTAPPKPPSAAAPGVSARQCSGGD